MLGTYAHCNIEYAKSPLLSQRSKTAEYDHARCFFVFSFSIWDSLNSGVSGADFHTRDANWQSRGVSDAVSDRDNDLQVKIGRQGCLQGQKKKSAQAQTPVCAHPHQPHTGHSLCYVCWSYNFLSRRANEGALDGGNLPLSKTHAWLYLQRQTYVGSRLRDNPGPLLWVQESSNAFLSEILKPLL